MMRDFGEAIGETVIESMGRAFARSQEQRPLSADLLESDDAYLVVFDAPDAKSDDVQVRFEENRVIVRVDRFREFHEEYRMRFPGRGLSLEGSVTLPSEATVDPSEASATLKENGTLQVSIPKMDTESEGERQADSEESGGESGDDDQPDEDTSPTVSENDDE